MSFPYNDVVLEHFKNPRNIGSIKDPDGKATEGSPACGDMVSLYLNVDPKTLIISDIKFESYGCASNIATGSIITELAKGQTIDEAKKITWKQASEALGGLPSIKVHCSVLAIETLRAAIQNYEEKNGLVTEKVDTTVEVITKRLKKVMNPIKGLDMIRTNLVKDISVKDGIVDILIDLPENHQFANAIKSDAIEKIETLWDVKEVNVTFTE